MAREGSKTAAAIAVMTKHADKPMEAVLPLIAKATGHDLPHARNYYVWCVRKGVAPGVIPVRAAAPKTAKEKAVKRMVKEVVAKTVRTKADAVKSVTKSPEEIERIKAANMARMKAVLGKVKQNIRMESDEVPFAETDSFAAPAFLTKDEMYDLI
jgi:hypothetical protein